MIILKRRFKKSKSFFSLSEAVEEVGKKRCVFIVEGICSVITDITIPRNIKVKFPLTGSFNVSKNKTLMIENYSGNIYSSSQIFKGDGKLEWWGKKLRRN